MPRKFTRVNRKGKLHLTRKLQATRKLQGTRKRQRGGSQSSLFNEAYVISADINSDRYKDIEKKTKIANLSIKHWKAIVINKHDSLRFSLPLKGIGKSLFSDRTGKIFNLGSIGCFLSHRSLLEHIANVNTGIGTLILEDDVEIFPDVLKRISDIEPHIPGDWDILFLDRWGETKSEIPVYKNVVKVKKTLDTLANWGTYSYIVKNSSIKTRILPYLERMVDFLDVQYTIYADKINEYIAYGIIPFNKKHNSISTIWKHDMKGGSLKKVLIIMSDNRALGKEYNALTACINYEYSRKHGYDFIYYRPYLKNKKSYELYNCLDTEGNKRHAAWSKLLSSKKALKLNYDYVVYIDSDCIFKDFSKRIEEYVKPYPEKDILFLNDKPWGTMYPCSGFYISKNSPESKRLMNDWYSVNMPENNTIHPWEQAAIMKIFKGYNIGIIDDWMFQEKQGQFLRHIGSGEKQNREPYFKDIINSMGIDINNIISKIKVVNYDTTN